ncbi:MAG: hypothetical protein ACI8QS_000425 [Planctomycetota bacterium]|jgi:hypothetical protein
MRSLLQCLALLLVLELTACGGPAVDPAPTPPVPEPAQESEEEESPREAQRLLNHATWEAQQAQLARHHGSWILIASGEVLGNFPDFGKAWGRAQDLPQTVLHAYLYRAGVDDEPVTFALSPFLSESPHWNQLGRRIRIPWRLTMYAANNSWHRGEQSVVWGGMEARLMLEDLEETRQLTIRAVASNLFQEDLTLSASDARALELGRFTAPLPAYYQGLDDPCEKVVLRLRIPELDICAPAVAFVLPDHLFAPGIPTLDPGQWAIDLGDLDGK